MTNGEVRVRDGSSTTTLETHSLDGRVEVDAGADRPLVRIPQHARVQYEHPDELATDGGTADAETAVSVRGLGLQDETVNMVLAAGAFALMAAGYTWGTEDPAVAAIAATAGAALTWLGLRAKIGGGRSA